MINSIWSLPDSSINPKSLTEEQISIENNVRDSDDNIYSYVYHQLGNIANFPPNCAIKGVVYVTEEHLPHLHIFLQNNKTVDAYLSALESFTVNELSALFKVPLDNLLSITVEHERDPFSDSEDDTYKVSIERHSFAYDEEYF